MKIPLKEKSKYDIFNDCDFQFFMTKSSQSIWECQLASKHRKDLEDVSILKLHVKDSTAIPFIVMGYNRGVYLADSFGSLYNEQIDGVYLVEQDAIILSSNYRLPQFSPLLKEIKLFTSEELTKQMEAHLHIHLKEAVSLRKDLGVDPADSYENLSSISNWYLNQRLPIDFIGKNMELFRTFQNSPLAYMIKYVSGEDIVQDGIGSLDIEKYAAVLSFVEQKYIEYDNSEKMQRNLELLKILREQLKDAVNVTAVKKDGSQLKVENIIRFIREDVYQIGSYKASVLSDEVAYFLYKKKSYGKI